MDRKRMGRPPKAPEDRAGPAIQFRVRAELKDEIARQATLAERSISEECEFRLNRSVQREASIVEVFGSAAQQTLVLTICNAIRRADALSDGPSDNVLQGYAAAIAAVEGLAGMSAKDVLDRASETGHGWRDAAEAAVSLERPTNRVKRKSMTEIMGR